MEAEKQTVYKSNTCILVDVSKQTHIYDSLFLYIVQTHVYLYGLYINQIVNNSPSLQVHEILITRDIQLQRGLSLSVLDKTHLQSNSLL